MSMNYELAKELKAAGFPQKNGHKPFGDEIVCVPTLSELIEAVMKTGIKGFELTSWEGESWDASGRYFGKTEISGSKENPESAVARLWIQLNK